jgi:hypothetical protein
MGVQLAVRFALLVLMLGFSSAVVSADDPTQRIVFAPGAKTITMKGTVTGYRSLRYLLAARAGQVISITFTSTKKSLYYSVMQGSHALRESSDGDFDDWSTTVPADGDCTIDVFLKSGDAKKNVEATFALTVSLTAE